MRTGTLDKLARKPKSVFFQALWRDRTHRLETGNVGDWKELAHATVGLTRLKSARQASRLESQGRVDVAVSSPKAVWRPRSFSWEDLSLFHLRPSVD